MVDLTSLSRNRIRPKPREGQQLPPVMCLSWWYDDGLDYCMYEIEHKGSCRGLKMLMRNEYLHGDIHQTKRLVAPGSKRRERVGLSHVGRFL